MAVLIQELTGSLHGDYFYPAIAGMAQSRNWYPVSRMRADEGVAQIVIGMGKGMEEGVNALRFSPRHPTLLPHFSKIEDILASAQRYFYALKMKHYDEELNFAGGINLERREIIDAASEVPVKTLTSRYNPDDHRLRDTMSGKGFPVVTFARILKYNDFPLPELLSMLLDLGHEGLGCPVEFEFSVDLNPSTAGIKGNFSILQMRPLVAGEARMDVHIDEDDIRRAFCYSTCCLGHGKSDDMADLVYVVPETFDPGKTVEISAEIGKLNTALLAQNKPYLLAGPGRWGSSDRFLGIPVKWKDISGGGAMMEIRNENISADPSEGSHFFHHITSLGIPYITVSEGTSDFFSWQWLATQPAENRTRYLRHICFKQPFVIKSNGRTGRCVVLRPESKKRSNTC